MMMDFPTTPALLDCANWGDRTASGNLHDPYWMARAVPWDMASRDCFGTCGYVAGGTPADIVCDLEQGVPAPTVTPWAVATSLTGLNAGPNQFVYGVNRSNQAFCCAYSEYRAAANQVDAVLMRGTEIGDRVRFHQCGGQDLRGITNAPFSIELRGMGGDDVLFGSDAAAGVSELIDGGDGADVIYGKGGDDLLRGGDGADVMHGGAGVDDVHGQGGSDHLQGGAGLDYLYGEGLPDYVCDEGDADELYGGGGLDLLAWRPVAGNPSVGIGDGQTSGANCFLFGLPWASNCVLGHTTWSTSCLDHWDLP